MGLKLDGHFIERMLGEKVVVIQQRHELTGGEIEGRVGRRAYVPIGLPPHDLDPRIAHRKFPQYQLDVWLGRGVVGQAQFPVGIKLVQDRLDHLAEV